MFIEGLIGFIATPEENPGQGARFRIRDTANDRVVAESEWITLREDFELGKDIGARVQLARGVGRRRYVLEVTSDVAGYALCASGVIGAEYR